MDNKEETNENETGDQKRGCPSMLEVVVMVLILLVGIGSFYCLGITGSLEKPLTQYIAKTNYNFSLFYSVSSLPATISCILAGYMMDSSFGMRKTTYVFGLMTVLGSLLFSIGGPLDSFSVMLAGCFLNGFGVGTLVGPIIFCYTLLWFKNTYASLVFSLSDNVSTVGTLLVFVLSTRILKLVSDGEPTKEGLFITIGISSSVTLVIAVCLIIITLLKPKNPNIVTSKREGKLLERLNFPIAFWILCFQNSTLSNAVFTFEQFSQVVFMHEYGMTAVESSNPITVLNLTKIVLAFPAGMILCRFGRNLFFTIASTCFTLLAHVLLILKFNPYISAGVLAFGYSFAAAAQSPMFGYLLNETNYGLGIGVMSSVVNLANVFYSMAAGKIMDSYGFEWVQIYFAVILAIGIIILSLMRVIDKENAKHLNLTQKERSKMIEPH